MLRTYARAYAAITRPDCSQRSNVESELEESAVAIAMIFFQFWRLPHASSDDVCRFRGAKRIVEKLYDIQTRNVVGKKKRESG